MAARAALTALVVSFLLSAPASVSAQTIGPAPYLVLTIGSSIDLATTLDAIHAGRGKEANPMLSHGGDAGLVAVKSISTAAVGVLMNAFAKRGHPTAAKVLGYVVGGSLTVLAAHNYGVGR